MAISIPSLTEDQIPAFARLELKALRSHPRIPMLRRAGYTDDLYAFYESNKRDSLGDSECRFMKATDEKGQLVAVSEWAFVLDPAKHAEGKKPVDPNGQPPINWPLMGNWELRRFFNLNLEKWEKDYLAGRPHGVEQADEHGVVMALEVTPAGLELYKRFGFRETEVIKADMKQFGYDKTYDEEAAKRVWMMREPMASA